MRLIPVNYILLACIATTLATTSNDTRTKRDLMYLKDLIATKLLGINDCNRTKAIPEASVIRHDNFKLFRIPGHDNILVKAVPKVNVIEAVAPVPEKVVEVNPTIAVLESYLGTRTSGETLTALQGIRNLLQSGILSASRDPVKVLPPVSPVYFVPPFMPEVVEIVHPKPIAVAPKPPKVPLVPVLPPPAYPPIPVPPAIVPQLVPVPVVPEFNNYSYKQIKGDGSMMTYSAKNGGNVVVTETHKSMPPPPPYITDRLQKIFYEVPFSGMRQSPVQPPLPQIPRVMAPRPVVFDLNPIDVPPVRTVVDVPSVKVNVNPYTYQQTYVGSGIVREQRPNVIIQEPMLMPAPPTYIVERIEDVAAKAMAPQLVKTHSGYSFKIVNNEGYIKPEKIVSSSSGSRVIQDSVLFAEPPTSRYVYKQIYNSLPDTFNVVDAGVMSKVDTKGEVNVNVNGGHFNPSSIPCNRPKIIPTSAVGSYSYKQIRNGGELISYPEFGVVKTNKPPVFVPEPIKMMPTPHLHVVDRIEKAAATKPVTKPPNVSSGFIDAKKTGTYSYKQITNDGSITTYIGSEDTKRNTPVQVTHNNKVIPAPPAHILQRIENVAAIAHSSDASKAPSGYSYKIVNGSPKQPEQIKVETNSPTGPVLFAEPIVSSYVYKQINNNNPKPFTVVKVGNKQNEDVLIHSNDNVEIKEIPRDFVYVPPLIVNEVPSPTQGTEKDKTNSNSQFSYKHVTNHGVYEYSNKDNLDSFNSATSQKQTVALYSKKPENPLVVDKLSSNPIETNNNGQFSHKHVTNHGVFEYSNKDDSKNLNRVTSSTPTVAPTIYSKQRQITQSSSSLSSEPVKTTNGQFSYKHVTNHGVYDYSNKDSSQNLNSATSSIPRVAPIVYSKEQQTTLAPVSLSSNPIVVPEEVNYSYKQNHADGSTITVNGNNENVISVEVSENNTNQEGLRGDIPDIFF